MKRNSRISMMNPSRLVERIALLYRLRLRLRVYLANQRVRATFGKRALPLSFPFLAGAALLLAGLGWFFFRPSLPQGAISKSGGAAAILKIGKSLPDAGAKGTQPSGPSRNGPGNLARTFMRTRVDLVNMRTGPFLESEIISRLDAGHVVEVLKRKGDWVLVAAGHGLRGWIYADLLQEAGTRDYEAWMALAGHRASLPAARRDPADPRHQKKAKREIRALLNTWKGAWEAKDIDRYMSLYSRDFFTPRHDREAYRRYKQYLFARARFIAVTLAGVRIQRAGDRFMARFIQTYQSDSVHSITIKIMHFRREGGEWKIYQEAVVKNRP